MSATRKSLQIPVNKVNSLIRESKAVLIGAGAGLSAAAGLLYMDFETFKKWFPGYHEKYGLQYLYEACFYNFPTPEEYYAFWAKHILTVRFDYPAGHPYKHLYNLVEDKHYFVLTTNVDGQFIKAGFDSQRLCTPQGDYGFFQCSKPCTDELYLNRTMLEEMMAGMDHSSMKIQSQDIPRCPRCGCLLKPNIREDSHFVEKPWMEKMLSLEAFINQHIKDSLLLLEIGAGYNTPSIIRFPFEEIALTNKNATLIRINQDNPGVDLPVKSSQFISIHMDAGKFLKELVAFS
ncbi:NAD-dependent protein deacetylase, SIR2 family [bacterium]|nr:NAD-dependent protein deacetylase, SIR2 family [bacterium]